MCRGSIRKHLWPVRMNGIIAEFVRTMPGARRSGNPGASVAAIGKLADWITA